MRQTHDIAPIFRPCTLSYRRDVTARGHWSVPRMLLWVVGIQEFRRPAARHRHRAHATSSIAVTCESAHSSRRLWTYFNCAAWPHGTSISTLVSIKNGTGHIFQIPPHAGERRIANRARSRGRYVHRTRGPQRLCFFGSHFLKRLKTPLSDLAGIVNGSAFS